MGYERSISDEMESTTDFTCALVVLSSEVPQITFGGGYLSIRKPFTDMQLEAALDNAVVQIVRLGNNALPRDKARIRAEFALKRKEDTGVGRMVVEMARGKNNADRRPRQ